MKRRIFLGILISSVFSAPASAQYVIHVPYLFIDVYDASPAVGQMLFSVPRPDVTYQSVRLRGLSDGLGGFVQDPYSDHFRNPAHRASAGREVYGDVGSVGDNGKFMFGGVFTFGKSSLTGFANIEHLLKRRLTLDRTTFSSHSPATVSAFSQEFSPRTVGGRLAFSTELSRTHSLGLSYQITKPKLDERSETSYQSGTTPVIESIYRDQSRDGELHRASIGTITRFEESMLEITAAGLLTKHTLTETVRQHWIYFMPASMNFSHPTDVKTTGLLISAMIQSGSGEKIVNRVLLQGAYTEYEVDGTSLSEYRGYPSYRRDSSVRSAEGTILDLRAGAGIEQKISRRFSGYTSLSVNYARNKSTGSERGSIRDSSFSFDTTIVVSKVLSDVKEGFDIRLPLAVEYFIGEHVTFRGGLEPRYRSGVTSTDRTELYGFPHLSTVEGVIVEARGLSLAMNFGVSAHHTEYGRIEMLFGNLLTETRFWSVAIQYVL